MAGNKTAKEFMEPRLQEAENLIGRYLEDVNAAPFWGPVLWREWGLMDYPKIVKEPMDLGRVKQNLAAAKYDADLAEFSRHVRLVWRNCMLYNEESSDFYKRAKTFEKRFEKDLSKLMKIKRRKIGAHVEDKRIPTLDEKASFCDMIRQLNEINLGKLIESLDVECEDALIRHSSDEVEIDMDAIDMTNFRKHENLLRKFIAEEKLAAKNGACDNSDALRKRFMSQGEITLETLSKRGRPNEVSDDDAVIPHANIV